MNKLLVLVMCVALLVACKSVPAKEETVVIADNWNEVIRFIDEEAGVVCWWTGSYRGGISCLPISQTKLDIGR